MDLCKIIPRRKSGRWRLPKKMKSLFGRYHVHKCCFIDTGRAHICTVSIVPISERLPCTERQHSHPSRYLKTHRENWDFLAFGNPKIKEAFHHGPNSNHVEELQSCLQDCLANSRVSSHPPAWSSPKRLVLWQRENPFSNSTEIQWIRAVRLLQNRRMLRTTRQHTPKAHFLRSISLEGLMRPDFSLHSYPAVNSPRFGSQQKPAKTVTGFLVFFLCEARGFLPLAADAGIERHGWGPDKLLPHFDTGLLHSTFHHTQNHSFHSCRGKVLGSLVSVATHGTHKGLEGSSSSHHHWWARGDQRDFKSATTPGLSLHSVLSGEPPLLISPAWGRRSLLWGTQYISC